MKNVRVIKYKNKNIVDEMTPLMFIIKKINTDEKPIKVDGGKGRGVIPPALKSMQWFP